MGVSWFLRPGEHAHDRTLDALYLVAISIAITVLGPGAFSLDARLFGRREIIIPVKPRDHHFADEENAPPSSK
jgi:hypothetical protein